MPGSSNQTLVGNFVANLMCLAQIDELKSCIEEREEELSRLRTATVSAVNCCRHHLSLSSSTSSAKLPQYFLAAAE